MDFIHKYIMMPLAIIFAIIVILMVMGAIRSSGLFNGATNIIKINHQESATPSISVGGSVKLIGPNIDNFNNQVVACTMDAYMCSNGTYVGRTGSDCSFRCPDGQIIK